MFFINKKGLKNQDFIIKQIVIKAQSSKFQKFLDSDEELKIVIEEDEFECLSVAAKVSSDLVIIQRKK